MTSEELHTFEQGVAHDARTVQLTRDVYDYLIKKKIGMYQSTDDYSVSFYWHDHPFVVTAHPDGFWLQQAENPENHALFKNIDTLKQHLATENRRQNAMKSPMGLYASDVACFSRAILRAKGFE